MLFEEQPQFNYEIPAYLASTHFYLSDALPARAMDPSYPTLSPPADHNPFDDRWSQIPQLQSQSHLLHSAPDSFLPFSHFSSDNISANFDQSNSLSIDPNYGLQNQGSDSPRLKSQTTSEEPEIYVNLSDIASTPMFEEDETSPAPPVPRSSKRARKSASSPRKSQGTKRFSVRARAKPRSNGSDEEESEIIPGSRKRRRAAKTPQSDTDQPKRRSSRPIKRAEKYSSDYGESDDDSMDSVLADDDSSSDVYIPSELSRSPNPKSSAIPDGDASNVSDSEEEDSDTDEKPSRRGGRRRAPRTNISGAVALRALESANRSATQSISGDADPSETSSVSGSRRKVPFPMAVPNVMKKSRGRKVPVTNAASATGAGSDIGDDSFADSFGVAASPAPSLAVSDPMVMLANVGAQTIPMPSASSVPSLANLPKGVKVVNGGIKKPTGERRYVCTAEGCGKCFVRGEHLKRHVRSLHTWEKPHVCPYKGCGKSFSRRDNLAQHVKVHI